MFINHEYPYHVLYSIYGMNRRKEKTKKLFGCLLAGGIFLSFLLFVGGNFLLFFIMFGKYRLPPELILSQRKKKKKKKPQTGERKVGRKNKIRKFVEI